MQETAVMRAYATVWSEGQHPDIHSLTGANSMVQRTCMMQEVVSEKNRSELRLWSHGVVPMVWWYPVFPAWAWNRWIRHGPWWPWFPLLTFRLLNSWLIRTSFNPAAWLSFYQIRMGWVVFNGKHGRLEPNKIDFSTFFEDEYWQGPEVAHAWYYGYGGDGARDHGGQLTWEWEKCIALRGVLHPGSIPKQAETKNSQKTIQNSNLICQGETWKNKTNNQRHYDSFKFNMFCFFHFVTLTEKWQR